MSSADRSQLGTLNPPRWEGDASTPGPSRRRTRSGSARPPATNDAWPDEGSHHLQVLARRIPSMREEGVPEVGMADVQETLDAVALLAGRVAHHLNNLLTVVDGNASHLLETLEAAGPVGELEEIRSVCGRASGLATRLLAISGCRWCEPRVLDLRGLVADMDLGRFFGHNVVFCTDFPSTTCPVRVDPAHVEEVVLGLVLNAREAVGDRGTVRLGIDVLSGMTSEGSPAGGWVQLEVSDSGPGMDRDTLARIFHPFFSTRPFAEDRGLGLSVACGIVRQFGGTMRVSSAPGHGTTVRLWLPVAAPGVVKESRPESTASSET